jgi:hypothetical protein
LLPVADRRRQPKKVFLGGGIYLTGRLVGEQQGGRTGERDRKAGERRFAAG